MDIRKYISDNEPTVIMMIGLSGSGKSTVAKEIKEQVGERVTILSSDELRQSLFGDVNDQTHNEEVFSYIKKHTRSVLESDSNQVCVVDATNLSVKDRSWLFCQCGTNKKGRKIAVLLPTIYDECLTRNSQRQRVVPVSVIERQVRKFEIPFYEEGWDKILIWNVEDESISLNEEYKTDSGYPDVLFSEMTDFNQRNHHHKYTLDRHCLKAYQELLKRTDNPIFLRAAQIHDIGKVYVQVQKENSDECSYHQHHNYGAYYALSHWKLVGIRDWMGIDSVDSLLECLFYINYHMQPFFIQNEKTENKYKNLWGDKKYSDIVMFNECDKIASGTERID